MRGGAHGGRRGQLQATEPNRAWNEPQSAQLWFSWLETQSIRLVPMAGANSERVTEQRGKAHPCHASVAHTRNRFEKFAGSFYGRYWAPPQPQRQALTAGLAFFRSQLSCPGSRPAGSCVFARETGLL